MESKFSNWNGYFNSIYKPHILNPSHEGPQLEKLTLNYRDKLTIYGDWLYDWAKFYQSIIGYDEILLSKYIDKIYKENIIDIFKNYFINKFSEEDFENLKMITKSLIFTLIPLHNNEKCIKYYNLLFSEYLN